MITDYQTLDQQQTQGNIAINQNYYSFVVLLFLAIIVILGLLYFGGKTNTSSNTSLINLNSQPQVSSTLSTSYIVITGILFSLIIVCISIVITRTGANSSGLYKLFENIIPSTFPELQISKFGWS
jgi:NADH:ubiquinone oxidoreductase subunit 6 (subunit J)